MENINDNPIDWQDVVHLLGNYGVVNAGRAPGLAGGNGLKPHHCIKIIQQWNAGGKQGGSAALYKTVTGTLVANLDAVVSQMQPADEFDRGAAHRVAVANTDQVRREGDPGRNTPASYQSKLARLLSLYGEEMAAMDDPTFWATAGIGQPGERKRHHCWNEIACMEAIERRKGN